MLPEAFISGLAPSPSGFYTTVNLIANERASGIDFEMERDFLLARCAAALVLSLVPTYQSAKSFWQEFFLGWFWERGQ